MMMMMMMLMMMATTSVTVTRNNVQYTDAAANLPLNVMGCTERFFRN